MLKRVTYQSRRSPSLPPAKKGSHGFIKVVLLVVILLASGLTIKTILTSDKTSNPPKSSSVAVSTNSSTTTIKTTPATTKTTATVNACASNTLNQLILVSISQRQLWACDGTTVAYNSPVITGMDFLAADLTPTGTYHIYGKITNTVLTGHDSTGSWSDPVSYWMPFLDNQYGAYGFHDATWRPSNAFGNVSPDSSNASHGCVECPLATAAWLYNWSVIGTTVTIEA
jgi:lipoprotein-anchoring transpeptidase ErfK/SrfK